MTQVRILDAHVIVRDGDRILMSQRGGPYGYGRWHLPSGKIEHGESVTAGAARELAEETGLVVEHDHLVLVHVVHHTQAAGERVGFFFLATKWAGEPENREPDKCLDLRWFPVDALPDDVIEYPAAGLLGYLDGRAGPSLSGW